MMVKPTKRDVNDAIGKLKLAIEIYQAYTHSPPLCSLDAMDDASYMAIDAIVKVFPTGGWLRKALRG